MLVDSLKRNRGEVNKRTHPTEGTPFSYYEIEVWRLISLPLSSKSVRSSLHSVWKMPSCAEHPVFEPTFAPISRWPLSAHPAQLH